MTLKLNNDSCCFVHV